MEILCITCQGFYKIKVTLKYCKVFILTLAILLQNNLVIEYVGIFSHFVKVGRYQYGSKPYNWRFKDTNKTIRQTLI